MLFRKLKLDWRYAFGEVVIVIVGVLVALAVNNWNGNRLDRFREQQYIMSLAQDFRADTSELTHALELSRLHQASARNVLSVIQNPKKC